MSTPNPIPVTPEAVLLREASRAELADRIHVIRESVEDRPIDPAPLRRDDVGIVPAVLREDDARPGRRQARSNRAVEKRGVLVGVHHIDAAAPDVDGQSPVGRVE